MNILPDFESTYKLLNTAADTYRQLTDSIAKCEGEENDIRHAMELGDLNYKERAKLATQLTKILKERRKHKDDAEVVEPLAVLMQDTAGTTFLKKLSGALGESRKADKAHVNRKYFPRSTVVSDIIHKEKLNETR